MKTSHAVIAAAVASLLPAAIAKKESPHRVFKTTRSKASKATHLAESIDPSPVTDTEFDPVITSKAGKAGAKTVKDLFPSIASKAAKSGAAKCHKEDEVNLAEFEITLDFSSLSMSTSMSYNLPSGKSGKAASTKCFKSDVADYESATSGDSWWVYSDDDWYYSIDDLWGYGGDDYFAFDDFYYNENDVVGIVRWFTALLAECANVPLEWGSCLVENVIEVLASGPEEDRGPMRMLRGAGARKMQSLGSNSTVDDWGIDMTWECETPTYEDIEAVIDQAYDMCAGSGVYVTDDQHEMGLDSFVRIFTNETCLCGYY
jgi:hypothetical protein